MTVTNTQLQEATNVWWEDKNKVENIWATYSPMLWALLGDKPFVEGIVQPGELVNGGNKVRSFFEYGPTNRGGWGPNSEFNTTAVDIINGADFDWGGANASCTIGFAEKRANTGTSQLIPLAIKKLENCRLSIQDALSIILYRNRTNARLYSIENWSGQDTHTEAFLDGLEALVGLDTTTVHPFTNYATTTKFGDVAENDISAWKAQFDGGTGSKTTTVGITEVEINNEFLQKARDVSWATSRLVDCPNYFFMDSVLLNSYSNQLMNLLRMQPATSDYMAKVGFRSVMWEGIPLVYDPYIVKAFTMTTTGAVCTAANAKKIFWGINTNYLKLKTHGDYAFTKPVWEHKAKSGGNDETAGIIWQGVLTTSHRAAAASLFTNVIPAT